MEKLNSSLNQSCPGSRFGDLVILACTVFEFLTDPPVWQTKRQTDGQTHWIAMAKMRYSSRCYCT